MYKDYTVRIVFDKGLASEYICPHVFAVSDPKEGMKATIIQGTRGDGSIVIPGGKKSQEITVKGRLWDEDGYADITALINEMRAKITTNLATFTMEHWDSTISGGGAWVTDWAYSVRRIAEIDFPESLRTDIQDYELHFLVVAY